MSLITPTLQWIGSPHNLKPPFLVGLGEVGDIIVYDTLRIQYSRSFVRWVDYIVFTFTTVNQLSEGTLIVSAAELITGIFYFRARFEQLVSADTPWTTEVIGDWSTVVTVNLQGATANASFFKPTDQIPARLRMSQQMARARARLQAQQAPADEGPEPGHAPVILGHVLNRGRNRK